MIRLIGRILGTGITLLFIAISASLALNNAELVSVSFWPWNSLVEIPLWLVISIAFGAGLLLGGLAMMPSLMRQRLTIRALTKSLAKKDKANLIHANNASANEKKALPPK